MSTPPHAQALDAKLRSIIEKELDIPLKGFDSDAHLMKTVGIDSMGMLDVIVAVEQEFKIHIHQKDFSRITNLKTLAQVVSQYQAGGEKA